MKQLKIFFLSLLLLITLSTGVKAEYLSDVIVTSPNGIWTDSRTYSSLGAAITAVGANQRTIVIAKPQVVAALTVPANVTLRFERDGAIANSGILTINTTSIIADNHQIFTGTGDIDFADGSIVRLSWFSNLLTALTVTADDKVTLIINKSITALASYAVGANVILRWDAPGNIITANAGVVISNINQVEAGNYQILAGAGSFRFRDGTELNLSWFPMLRTALTWINTNKVSLVVNTSSPVDYSDSVPSNINIRIERGGDLAIAAGITLTFASYRQIDIGPYYLDPFTGTGSVTFTGGSTYSPATTLTGSVLFLLYIPTNMFPYEIDALNDYGSGTVYSDVTLMAACTAIGANAETLLIRPGVWTQSANRDYTAVCPNAIFKFAYGASISHGAFTTAIPTVSASASQIFSGAGVVTITYYPQDQAWFGNTERIDAVGFNIKSASVLASPYTIQNVSFSASVSAKALTVALKGINGSDPSTLNPVNIAFRSATITDPNILVRSITSASSITLSSGSTLGFTAGQTGNIYVWAIDNAGTVELALSHTINWYPINLVTTMAEGGAGAADSAITLYSTTARTNKSCHLLGVLIIQTGAVAGQWDNAPTQLSVTDDYGQSRQVWSQQYTDASGIVQDVSLGAQYYVLVSNGATSAPTFQQISTTTIADHSITGVKFLAPIAAGTEIYLAKAATERSGAYWSYTKMKETAPLTRHGAVRVSFQSYSLVSAGVAKVYKNGVAVGAEHIVDIGSYSSIFTDDISVDVGDVIQVYAYEGAGNSIVVKDLYVTANDPYCVRETL